MAHHRPSDVYPPISQAEAAREAQFVVKRSGAVNDRDSAQFLARVAYGVFAETPAWRDTNLVDPTNPIVAQLATSNPLATNSLAVPHETQPRIDPLQDIVLPSSPAPLYKTLDPHNPIDGIKGGSVHSGSTTIGRQHPIYFVINSSDETLPTYLGSDSDGYNSSDSEVDGSSEDSPVAALQSPVIMTGGTGGDGSSVGGSSVGGSSAGGAGGRQGANDNNIGSDRHNKGKQKEEPETDEETDSDVYNKPFHFDLTSVTPPTKAIPAIDNIYSVSMCNRREGSEKQSLWLNHQGPLPWIYITSFDDTNQQFTSTSRDSQEPLAEQQHQDSENAPSPVHAKPAGIRPQYLKPFPNKSSFRLANWYWNSGDEKSLKEFQDLLGILRMPDFNLSDALNTDWAKIVPSLGKQQPKHVDDNIEDEEEGHAAKSDDNGKQDSEEWVDDAG
ncbi:hypothetical protein FA15DRAFT_711140 [Coprinopsis marcescibilis]|uniref:Uncharacterized protein n=1 Tax=Coprinopsis marcescibilis TaxID=230819 RepID=A0A5C3KB08_COPMA|nr:hypothetical protein FA15DRAFT_711140 [Coprinopsis marcescibilis]